MKKEELAALLGSSEQPADVGAIEDHLHALAVEDHLPDLAVAMCAARIEESGAPLRAILIRAANSEVLSEDEELLLFRGLYILGGARVTEAWPDLLRLLRRPPEELDRLLGDAVTESLSRIAAGMFNRDAESLFAVIADRSVEEYVREALFGAATYLTWEGRIERDRMREFVARFHAEKLADDDDYAWIGWLNAIALLGWRDLAPLYERAWEDGRVDADLLSKQEFESDLTEAERNPGDIERLKRFNLGYIDDVIDALAWTRRSMLDEDEPDASSLEPGWFPDEPYINPMRHVGRNDPCPCGSGKKAKKCCLG